VRAQFEKQVLADVPQ
jgi:hypothetical protein